jgi:hypothetical protein
MLGLYPLSGAPLGASGSVSSVVVTSGAWDIGTWDTALWDSLLVAGNEATGGVGSLGVSQSFALSGNQAAGAVGTVTANIIIALTGVQATGQVGTEGESVTIALTGVAATGQVGNLTAENQPIIFIDDTHDGDFLGKKFAEEQARAAKRREAILNAYEIVVEGRPEVAEEIAEPFTQLVVDQQEMPVKQIYYDALFADLDRVEAIWSNYIDLDDEEVLALL